MDKWVIRTPRLPSTPQQNLPPPPTPPVPASSSNSIPKSLPPTNNDNHTTAKPSAPNPSPSPDEPPTTNLTLEVQLPEAIYDIIPPTQVPTLLPIHDSTAYIEEHLLVTQGGLAPDGNLLPHKLHYIIGWRDAPGPMISVEADKVLDYVSPYALEQYEYGLWKERRDARRAKKEEEEVRKEEEVKARAAKASASQKHGVSATAAAGKAGKGRGKKGRRGRARKAVPQQPLVSEEFVQQEARRRAGDAPQDKKPSLSTPQKPRMAGLIAATSEEEEIPDPEMEEETSEDAEAATYMQLCAEAGRDAGASKSAYPDAAGDVSMGGMEPPRKRIKSSSPLPKVEPRSRASTRAHTPRGTTPSNIQAMPPPHSALAQSSLRNQYEATPPITAFTPVRSTRRSQSAATSANDSRANSIAASQSTTSCTAGKGGKPISPPPNSQHPAPATEKKKRKRKSTINILSHQGEAEDQQKAEQQSGDAGAGTEWDVKCIEGMKHMRVDGRKARYFLVRWEGDWPPELNPTWEPEENIMPSMVRKYLAAKNGRKRGGFAGSADGAGDMEDNTWTLRRYSSVTEAFEDPGAAAVNGGAPDVIHGDEDDDVEMGEETFQVTEGPVRGEGSRAGMSPDVLSQQFDMTFPRAY